MSGKHAGVSVRIKAVAKHAFYVHCNAHCLNLVLVDMVPEAACFFSLLQKLYVFMLSSYIHNKWLEVQQEIYGGQSRKLQKLSDTKWACRHFACRNMMDRLPAVICVLEDIVLERSGDRSVEARGLLAQIDLPFIGLLSTLRKVLGDIKLLSDMLQSPSLDLARAVELIEALQDTYQHYRQILDTAKKYNNISIERERKRQSKISSRLEGSVVTSTVGGRRSD